MPTLDNTSYTTNPLLRTTGSAPLSYEAGVGRMYQAKGAGPEISTGLPGSSTSSSTAQVGTPEPTIGETLTGIKSQAMTIQGQLDAMKAAETKPGTLGTPTYDTGPDFSSLGKEETEQQIARRQRQLFQSEIDATNRVYDDMLAQERLAGQGRLGTATARAARGGLLGSNMGDAQYDNMSQYNVSEQRAVQNERMAKIGAIEGTMRKAVSDELERKRLARKEGAESIIAFHAASKERRQENIKLAARSVLAAGLDPTTMDPAELDAIGKPAGISAKDIILSYNELKAEQDAAAVKTDLETRKTEAEIANKEANTANAGYFELSEGQSRYDKDGNVVASKGKTYAPGTGGGGSVSLTADDKRTLLGGGWSESDISTLEAGIRSEGLQSVIAAEKAAGATPAQIKALQKAYGSTGEETQFLTKDYFRSLFGDEKLSESATEAKMVTGGDDWIPFNESGDTEAYLNSLQSMVDLYRQAGYSDKEILKQMQ